MSNIVAIAQRIVDHLWQQKERSVTLGTSCAYRGKDGLQCAVGCIIPNSAYSDLLEGHGVRTLQYSAQGKLTRLLSSAEARLQDALTAAGVNVYDADELGVLANLQGFHDSDYSRHKFTTQAHFNDMMLYLHTALSHHLIKGKINIDQWSWSEDLLANHSGQ